MRDTFEIVEWPDVQFLMDKPGFMENSHLINDIEGINEYGSSAYLVNSAWLEKVTGASPEQERMIIVSITDISPQGDAYCSILTSDSPEDALNQIRGYIDTEISEGASRPSLTTTDSWLSCRPTTGTSVPGMRR